MNNLLRTLTEIQAKSSTPEPDLRLLLTTVKEARRQCLDNKAADAFYDSLEGLLLDLRTITIDNHDAEPFLKPVSKTDVPDYYDVITTPMDLQTMLKKVKQKAYKSKREFKDDLDLIWSNCFTYNAAENHPLRQCATRLRGKAEKLLQHITDRKDRLDPTIPGDIAPSRGVTPKVNGTSINGIGRGRAVVTRSPSPVKPFINGERHTRRDIPFPEEHAILRTPKGMATFVDLDRELDTRLAELEASVLKGSIDSGLEDRLREYIVPSDLDTDSGDLFPRTLDGQLGEKRKLNGFSEHRPRKRARMESPEPLDPVELWWQAMRSDEMIGNGVPTLRYPSSQHLPDEPKRRPLPKANRISSGSPKRKRKKTKSHTAGPKTLLYHMNNNIRTLRKVRTTHAKFTALKESNDDGSGAAMSLEMPPPPAEEIDEILDERPWKPQGSGVDMGEEHADDCLHWMGSKVLEHVGFQGTSKAALDVLAGVTSDYLLNVGRTIHFLSEKYANKMTAEEIILHTLFESGTTRVSELERYVKDDVVRYGTRLSELEKKLATAYSEATTVEAWDDDALFKEEEEEEEGEFVMGNFADSFGEDFLGLRALGIADEFGLSSLTIPKKLLKGRKKPDAGPAAAKPTEPPPPFPPPPPFVPMDSKNVDNQIGLLKPYYQQRISSLSTSTTTSIPPSGIPAPPMPDLSTNGYPIPYPPSIPVPGSPPPVVLPDDSPTPIHTKIGPIGQIQITKSAAAASASKKKAKPKGPTAAMSADANATPEAFMAAPDTPNNSVMFFPSPVVTPKKGKGNVNQNQAAKKKPKGIDSLPPVVIASA